MNDAFSRDQNDPHVYRSSVQFTTNIMCITASERIMPWEGLLQNRHFVHKYMQFCPRTITFCGKWNTQLGAGSSQRLSMIFVKRTFNSSNTIIIFWRKSRSSSMTRCPKFLKFMEESIRECAERAGDPFSFMYNLLKAIKEFSSFIFQKFCFFLH